MKDTNGKTIRIGDIVKIEGSPNKSDNTTYVVAQDGTNAMYSGESLTLYRVAKVKGGGYALSNGKYNIAFFPLVCYSSRFKFSRAALDAATIEVLIRAVPERFTVFKAGNEHEPPETEKDSFRAEIMQAERDIGSFSCLTKDVKKLTAFLSNITLKGDQVLSITKRSEHSDYTYRRGFPYKIHKSS